MDVTLEKLDERVPKVQCGTGSAPVNLSGKRTETKKAPLPRPLGPAGGCFFRNVFGPWSVLPGLFFCSEKERDQIMLESLEAALYPIVVNINTYLSS